MPEPAQLTAPRLALMDCPRSEPIQSLNDLWQRVGIRAMALPKIGRAGALLADKHCRRTHRPPERGAGRPA